MDDLDYEIGKLKTELARWSQEYYAYKDSGRTAMKKRDLDWLQRRIDRLEKLRDETIPDAIAKAKDELREYTRRW